MTEEYWNDYETQGYPDELELLVEEGDSYDKIAEAFGISKETLALYNPNVNMSQETPGETLRIPFIRPCRGTIYIIRRGDTLASIARRFGITEAELRRANPFIIIIGVRPGIPICIPSRPPATCTGFFYVIEPGDNLFRLASRFNTTVDAILRANPGLDPNRLIVGERICIPVPRPVPCTGFFYTVIAGDTLFNIALRFNTTVEAILRANPGLDPNRIFVGQRICIPAPQPSPCPGFIYTIVSGDTLFIIANRFNTSVEAILRANPGIDPNRLFVGQQICIPVPRPAPCPGIIYTVVAGDTLFSIAGRFNTSVDAILRVNPGLDPNRLFIGQQICIPR